MRRWRFERAFAVARVGVQAESWAAAYNCLWCSESCGIAVASVTAIVAQRKCEHNVAKGINKPNLQIGARKTRELGKMKQLPGARRDTASRPQEPSNHNKTRVQRQLKISISAVRWTSQTLVVRRESALVKLTTAAAGRDRRGTRRQTRKGSVARARAAPKGLWEDP